MREVMEKNWGSVRRFAYSVAFLSLFWWAFLAVNSWAVALRGLQ